MKRWTAKHLDAANLEKIEEANPVSIVGQNNLPLDGDGGMFLGSRQDANI